MDDEPLPEGWMEELGISQVRKCRKCGCTDLRACTGDCYWVEEDLCSRCAGL